MSQRGTRLEAAQTGEMRRDELSGTHETHGGRHGAGCSELNVYNREKRQPLLGEDCVFSCVRTTAVSESALPRVQLPFDLRTSSPMLWDIQPYLQTWLPARCADFFGVTSVFGSLLRLF